MRYWLAPHTAPTLDSDGFFLEPFLSSRRGASARDGDPCALADRDDVPALVLLGEAGIGKSTELDEAYERALLSGRTAIRVRLGSLVGPLIDRALLEHDAVRAWRERGEPVSLFLDALDEAPPGLPVAALIRDDLLGRIPADLRARRARVLQIRITCRSSAWPVLLERVFREFWGEGAVETYALAPLREADIAEVAEKAGLNPARFLADVRAIGAGPWAALPLTLKWLLASAAEGVIPTTRAELYARACRRLCEEQNEDRKSTGAIGALTPDLRMIVAARLAALMRLGGRIAVWTGPPDQAQTGDLSLPEMVGLDRASGDADLPVGERDVAEVVATGLFRAAGSHRARWVHESIPDYLAAWSLIRRSVEPFLGFALLTDPTDHRVVPQLRDVAAWAASLDGQLAERIAARDPVVAVSGDPQALPEAVRKTLVEQLLQAYDLGKFDTYQERTPRLHALNHNELSDQLRRWIRDRDAGADARYEAIGLATRCEVTSLVPDLLAVALDPVDTLWIRATSIRALSVLAAPEDIAPLRPVALVAAEDDLDGSLISTARNALWPAHLSFGDLLQSLRADSHERGGEIYQFSRFHLGSPDSVGTDQLLDGLRWAAGETEPYLYDLLEAVVKTGIARSEDEVVAVAVAAVLVAEIGENYGGRLESTGVLELAVPRPPPRPLVKAVVEQAAVSTDDDALFRTVRALQLMTSSDVPWLVEWLVTLHGPERSAVLRIVAAIFEASGIAPEDLQSAFDAVEKADAADLSAAVDDATQPWAIDDDRANRLRSAFVTHPEPVLVAPPLQDFLDEFLPAALEGSERGWFNVRFALQAVPTPTHLRKKGRWQTTQIERDDLTRLAAWKNCTPQHRAAIVDAAEAFLLSNSPDEFDWTTFEGGEEQTYRILDAPRAFFLLDREAPKRLNMLPERTWAAWLPAFLLLPMLGDEQYLRLLERAVAACPEDAPALARRALPIVGRLPARMSLDLAWGLLQLDRPELADAVLDFVSSDDVPRGERELLWTALAENGVTAAVDRLLETACTAEVKAAADAAATLAGAGVEGLWSSIAGRFDTDDGFASALVVSLSWASYRGRPAVASLPITALLALERRYYALMPLESEGTVGEVDDQVVLHRARRHVRDALTALGTREAEVALLALHEQFGDDDYAHRAHRAALLRRKASFTPLRPSVVLRLLGSPSQRLVRSADELFDVVRTAMDAFESWLRTDPPPRVFDLWNAVSVSDAVQIAANHAVERGNADAASVLAGLRGGSNVTQFVPKDESALSDLLQRFLRAQLSSRHVISHREVEILKGHTPDLIVSAVPEGADTPVSVAIEVKASWHPEVQTAIRTQLAEGYLDRSDCAHGIYLVGYYGSARWLPPPSGWGGTRRGRSIRSTLNRLRENLACRAAELSTGERQLYAVVVDASLPPSRAS